MLTVIAGGGGGGGRGACNRGTKHALCSSISLWL